MTPPASSSAAEELRVATAADLAVAPVRARHFAAAAGLSSKRQWEFAIAAGEAASNLLKHAGGGTLRFARVEGGVELLALDRGPGFGPLAEAERDGVSRGVDWSKATSQRGRIGLGLGLGTIRRLMDEVELGDRPGGGARVRAVKYGDPPQNWK